jgi:excisionase family DNA binding protein
MVTPADLTEFLATLCGSDTAPQLLVRDVASDIGWRPWITDDTNAFCEWLSARVATDAIGPNQLACYNLKEAAKCVGVSMPKFQTWLRRLSDPLPHVRDGRTILIPGFLLMEWLREESARNTNG